METQTSGAGVFAGMVLGSIIGIFFGPLGIITGGVLGALIGNKVEKISPDFSTQTHSKA